MLQIIYSENSGNKTSPRNRTADKITRPTPIKLSVFERPFFRDSKGNFENRILLIIIKPSTTTITRAILGSPKFPHNWWLNIINVTIIIAFIGVARPMKYAFGLSSCMRLNFASLIVPKSNGIKLNITPTINGRPWTYTE